MARFRWHIVFTLWTCWCVTLCGLVGWSQCILQDGNSGFLRNDGDCLSNDDSDSKPCRCPSPFSARNTDGTCVCECFDKQRDCIRAKRGKDFLPHDDRICILRGECMAPSCEFGTYLRRAGRCPRKQDKFEAWQRVPLHDEEYI